MAGRFTWFDLMTPDPEAAARFYASALGWGTEAWNGPMPYTMFKHGDKTFGGVMKLPEEAAKMGAPPHWLGYVGVDDVEAAAAKAKSLGATIQVPPTPIPGVGRFAVFSDPQGAVAALFQSTDPSGDGSNDGVRWHELMTTDLDAAWSFYSSLFGWKKTESMDMGPEMGPYQMFNFGGDGYSTGGMMKKPPMVPMANWTYYLATDDVDARAPRLVESGAKLMNGPMDVPGDDRIAQLQDPQGGMFAIVSRKTKA